MSFFATPPANNTNPNNPFASNQQQQQKPPPLFGNPPANPLQPQPTVPNLFATNTNTANANAGGGGLFGTTTTNPTTNAFGTNTNTTAGTTQQQQPQQQPQQQQPNALFGNSTTGTTGLFGSTNTNPAPTTNAGNGLFSLKQPTGPIPNAGIFGSAPSQTQTQPGGSNLFGASKPPGTGLFGSTANNPLFGGQQQQQQQQPQQQPQQPQPQSNIFGGAFGGSTNTNTNTNTLFGGNKNVFGGSTFGTGGLGSSTSNTGQQPQTGLGASTLTASTLLNPRPGPLAGSQPNPHQQQDAQTQFIKLTQSIEGLYNAWNPASRDCRFQHPFYNLVDPKQVSLYGRPANATNDALWEKAVRENPDPSCLVPVIAIGFDDLRERADAQTRQAAEHKQRLTDLKSRLAALSTQHSVSNASRILRATTAQTQLTQRLMAFIQHLHLLIPSVRSSSLRPEEEALRAKLEEIEEEMRRGRVKGKLNELWALIGALGAGSAGERGRNASGEWAVVDEEGLAQIAQILSEQQAGLQHLTKILQKDQKDLAIVMGNGKGADQEGENLFSSTTTLRSSSHR